MSEIDFSEWVDDGANLAHRLPGEVEAAIDYVAGVLGHAVYTRWTLAAVKRSYPSFSDARKDRPTVMEMLVEGRHREVIEYWQVGRIHVAIPADSPEPGAVLERLLASHPARFRKAGAPTLPVKVSNTTPVAVVEQAPALLPRPLADWLARTGRFANLDQETNTLGAINDAHAATLFLHERASRSKHTLRAYVTELRRLAAWCEANHLGPLSGLTRHDLLAYRHTLATGSRTAIDGAPGKASDAVTGRAIAVVTSLFGYWSKTGYLRANPAAALDAGRSGRTGIEPRRVLAPALLEVCDKWVDQIGAVSGDDLAVARRQAIWSLYRYAGVRLVELVWSDEARLPRVDIEDGKEWTLTVLGKRQKIRSIPLPDICVAVLQRYRRLRGLPPDPPAYEHVAIIHGLQDGSLRNAGLYAEIKAIFKGAADALPPERKRDAELLKKASPHWLRHGYARALVVEHKVPLPIAKDLLGHASIQTTAGYVKTDRSEQRQFVKLTFQKR